MLFLGRDGRFYLESGSVWPLGVCENVEVGNRNRVEKGDAVFKILRTFAVESRNNIGRNAGMRHRLLYGENETGVFCSSITAAHKTESVVIGRLKGDMEMRHEGARPGHKFNHLWGKQIGFYAANTVTRDRSFVVKNLQEVE